MNNGDIPKYPLYGYDNTEELDRDVEYMKGIYPLTVRKILKEVEDECDKLEYEGSMMFDVLPDTVSLQRLIDTILNRVEEHSFTPVQTESLHTQATPCRGRNCPPARPDYNHDGSPNWVRNLISSLLFNEMIHRRRRYRSRKRWF